jgi:hypothetical protein
MRQIHWWGAATGAAVLATAAFAAPSAFAAHSPAPVSHKAPIVKTVHVAAKGRVTAKNRDGDGRDRHWGRCPYPPNGHPTVVLGGPHHTRPGSVTLTGSVKVNGCGYKQVIVKVYKKTDEGHRGGWKALEVLATTEDDGSYAVPVTVGRGLSQFRAVVEATGGPLEPGMSDIAYVEAWR